MCFGSPRLMCVPDQASWMQVLALPPAPREPPMILFIRGRTGRNPLGRIFAASPIHPADVKIASIPSFCRPGEIARLCLSRSSPASLPQEIRELARGLACQVRVRAALVRTYGDRGGVGSASEAAASASSGAAAFAVSEEITGGLPLSRALPVTLQLDMSQALVAKVWVSLTIPSDASPDWELEVSGVSVAGQPLECSDVDDEDRYWQDTPPLPCRIPVVVSIAFPLCRGGCIVGGFLVSPAISGAGTLYIPKRGEDAIEVISRDGDPIDPIDVRKLRLSAQVGAAAFDDVSRTLFLGDEAGRASRIVALDPVSCEPRWTSRSGTFNDCHGIAVLLGSAPAAAAPTLTDLSPFHAAVNAAAVGDAAAPASPPPVHVPSPAEAAVVIASSWGSGKLKVHRVCDGAFVDEAEDVRDPTFVAADSPSATAFVSTGHGTVSAWHWDGRSLGQRRAVPLPPSFTGNNCPIAVVPLPRLGSFGTRCLVVGLCGSPRLCVLALPSLALLHEHVLEGMAVVGLAAAPCGSALAVCDAATGAIHVMRWPLAGM